RLGWGRPARRICSLPPSAFLDREPGPAERITTLGRVADFFCPVPTETGPREPTMPNRCWVQGSRLTETATSGDPMAIQEPQSPGKAKAAMKTVRRKRSGQSAKVADSNITTFSSDLLTPE